MRLVTAPIPGSSKSLCAAAFNPEFSGTAVKMNEKMRIKQKKTTNKKHHLNRYKIKAHCIAFLTIFINNLCTQRDSAQRETKPNVLC